MRLLLKLSGEFFATNLINDYVEILKNLSKQHKIGVVVGGGNLIRGRDYADRRSADILGLYATLLNGLILKNKLDAKIYNAFDTSFINNAQLNEIEENIIIFTGGLGIPYFSTDTAAIVRALDIKAELVLKATKVDGVYEKDPALAKSELFKKISYSEIIAKNLQVIDLTAASLAITHKVKMVIFNGNNPENIYDAILGKIGTTVEETC